MATQRQPILFALDEDGEVKHIDEVARGEKCRCIACGEKLIAKKGDRRLKIHHFAHAPGVDCEYGYESSLHLAAKHILEKAKGMVIPAIYINFPRSRKKPVLLQEAKKISIESVELECHLRDIIPDIVIHSDNSILIVEIFVTHSVNTTKLEKIRGKNISSIEIDLSSLDRNISVDELSNILLEDIQLKHWLYSAREAIWFKNFLCASEKLIKTPIKDQLYEIGALVYGCPMPSRQWDGKPCANFEHDCLRCPYHICSIKDENGLDYVCCTGRMHIADSDDFSISEAQRIEKNKKIEISSFHTRVCKTMDLLDMKIVYTCPNCGYALCERKGQFGSFWGCRMYPNCRFTIWYDPKKEKYQYSND